MTTTVEPSSYRSLRTCPLGPVTNRLAWTEQKKNKLASEIVKAHEACAQAICSKDKNVIRDIHYAARVFGDSLGSPDALYQAFNKHSYWFKHGYEIEPHTIRPTIKLVKTNLEKQLWNLTRTFWSMPYSKGYGRRLRFLILDEEHNGVIGIIGLQSPPADLKCRDNLFMFPKHQKLDLINQTLDAYTVGAIPPYSFLLGGKLCAGLLASDSIREAYQTKYSPELSITTDLSSEESLVAITTTSAFGRSSIYNRLKYDDRLLARPIGYTKGYGMLHLEHLYEQICDLLRDHNSLTPNGYGNGPKVRWQNVTKALMLLGLPHNLLAHGVQREVFIFDLVTDLKSGMNGGAFGSPHSLSVESFSEYWKNRWALPRAARFPEWRQVDSREMMCAKVHEWARLSMS
jgi:hypothetical protein